MRICRVSVDDELFFGLIEGLTDTGEIGEGTLVALLEGHPYGELSPEGRILKAADVRFVAPVLPSKVIAVGRNYAAHAKEMGGEVPVAPMIFLKPSTSVVGPGEPITLPWQSEQVEHEAELAIVIGRLCRDVPPERVPEVVLGYTCANDVTARDLQKTDGQWGRAKGFDSFCPSVPGSSPISRQTTPRSSAGSTAKCARADRPATWCSTSSSWSRGSVLS